MACPMELTFYETCGVEKISEFSTLEWILQQTPSLLHLVILYSYISVGIYSLHSSHNTENNITVGLCWPSIDSLSAQSQKEKRRKDIF